MLDAGQAFASRSQEFVLQVVVEAGPNSPLDAAQVYLDYDPGTLRAVSIGEGFVLEVGLQSNIDHRRGRVDYAAGTLRGVVSHPFTLAAVTFAVPTEARAGTTTVGFAPRRAPRQTKAVSRGFDITGNLIPVTLTIE